MPPKTGDQTAVGPQALVKCHAVCVPLVVRGTLFYALTISNLSELGGSQTLAVRMIRRPGDVEGHVVTAVYMSFGHRRDVTVIGRYGSIHVTGVSSATTTASPASSSAASHGGSSG